MNNSQQISMNYSRTLALVSELDNLADKLDKEIHECTNDNLNVLFSGWEGDNATEFLKKITAMQDGSSNTVSYIRKIAAGIRSNAEMVYKAELEAINIINTITK